MADSGTSVKAELGKFDYLRFTWADLHGISRGKCVPSRYVIKLWKEGVRAYAGIQTITIYARAAMKFQEALKLWGYVNVSLK